MKIRLTGSSYFLICLMVIALVVLITALITLPPISRLLPVIFSPALFILAAIKLWDENRAKKVTQTGAAESTFLIGDARSAEEKEMSLQAYLPILGWIAGFVATFYLLGMLVASPLLVLTYMKAHGTSWLTSIISTVIILAIVYFLFGILLEINLYPGLFFLWLKG